MLPQQLRFLVRLLFYLYAVLGMILFVFPAWSSLNFAWKVSPWVAMTIGAWCLGNAFIAYKSYRSWQWSTVYPLLTYLASFGFFQSLVLILFFNKLLFTPLGWLYIVTIALNLAASVFGGLSWYRIRPGIKREGTAVTPAIHRIIIFGVISVAVIAAGALFNTDPVVNGDFLPERMSLFTIRAFGFFYTCIFLGGATLLRSKSMTPVLTYAAGGLALTIPITLASLIYFRNVNLLSYPGGLIYVVAYFIVIAAAGFILWKYQKQ